MNQQEFLETIASMNNKTQNAFYQGLRAAGISEDEVRSIQAAVFYFKMYDSPAFYNAVKTAAGEQLRAELFN